MKKFLHGLCAALLLSVMLFALAGCKADGSKVFKYLKAERDFVGNPKYNGGDYKASFTVEKDLSYSLSVSDNYSNYDVLKNYSATGTKMEYLGYREEKHESTSWGITTHWTVYTHVIKLPEATLELNGNTFAFYLLADSDSKRSDTFTLKLVTANAAYDEGNISNIGTSFAVGYALKKA